MSSNNLSPRTSLVVGALLATLLLTLGACGADRPTPAYPASADPALEDTDLAQYVSGDEDEEEDYGEVDEEPFEEMPAEGADGDSTDGEAAPDSGDAATDSAGEGTAPAAD